MQRKSIHLMLLLFALHSVFTPTLSRPADESRNANLDTNRSASTLSASRLLFINKMYIQGLPIAEARLAFDASNVPALLALLGGPGEDPYRHNIVLVLGLVGDQRATAALIAYLGNAPNQQPSYSEFLALATIPHALGFLAERGDQAALEYLIRQSNPSAWQLNRVTWMSGAVNVDYRQHFMSKLVIWGLSVASKPRGDTVLQRLRARVASGAVDSLPGHYERDLDAAINRSQKIRTLGVDRVFANAGRPGSE